MFNESPVPRLPPAVGIEEVSFSYGDHLALAGISLQIQPEEIVGLLGPNGAGKSTTVKLFVIMANGKWQMANGKKSLVPDVFPWGKNWSL